MREISSPFGVSGSAQLRILLSRPGRGDLDQRRDVGRGGRMICALAPVREEHDRPPVEDALDEMPLPRPRRTGAVHLRRSDDGDGQAAVEEAPARPRPCSPRSPRASRRACRPAPSSAASRGSARRSAGARRSSCGCRPRRRTRPCSDSITRRAGLGRERQHEPSLLGRVADVVDQQVAPLAERGAEVVGARAVGATNRAPSTSSRGALRPVRSTSQPAASSRRATATPTWPVPPSTSARGIASGPLARPRAARRGGTRTGTQPRRPAPPRRTAPAQGRRPSAASHFSGRGIRSSRATSFAARNVRRRKLTPSG